MGEELRPVPLSAWEQEMSGGWSAYRQAVEFLGREEQQLALRLLAEAEIVFRSNEDQRGLWHALAGQTAAHWHGGDVALALARADAAMRAATAASDPIGISVVAWQLAVLHLHHEEYDKASSSFLESQEALSVGKVSAEGGAVSACAHLCREIDRWQEMYARRLITRRTAVQVVEAIQRDLTDRMADAGSALRVAWRQAGLLDDIEQLLLRPGALGVPLARLTTAQPSLRARLTRWWRTLTAGPQQGRGPSADEPPAVQEPVRLLAPSRKPPEEQSTPPPSDETPEVESASAPQSRHGARLAVNCFGRFRVSLDDQLIDRWDSVRGRTIFKYLITRRGSPAPKELLADMFWPDSEPELARRSLHQAIYCLRQSFKRVDPALAIVLFNGDCYQINPEISIWVDSEEFGSAIAQARSHAAAGKAAEAMRAYGVAADLAGGEFLEEDRYESWAEELRHSYRAMVTEALRQLSGYHYERGDYASAIFFSQRLLAQDSCDEKAHLSLIRCYTAQGLRHLAVRQYQICVNALKTELGLDPSDELDAMYQHVLALD